MAGQHLFRRYIDPGIGSGRDVVRFILLACTVTVICSSVALGGMVLVGMLSLGHASSSTGWPGGWATPSASCWPRR
jgi:hypothetical protein